MLERFLDQDKAIQHLSQEIKDVQKRMVATKQAQQDQVKRLQQQGELQHAAHDRTYKLEADMSTLASHIIELRREFEHVARSTSSYEQEMAAAMKALTQEIRQMRISANLPQSCPQGDRPTFVSNEPETGDTGHQPQELEQDVLGHPTDHSSPAVDSNAPGMSQMRHKCRYRPTDPIQYKRL